MPIRHPQFLLPPALLTAMLWCHPPQPAQAAETAGQDRVYTIQSGDTVSSIARKYGLSPEDILRANELPHPDRIAAGHTLRLPVTSPQKAATIRTPLLRAPWENPTAPEATPDEGDKQTAQVPASDGGKGQQEQRREERTGAQVRAAPPAPVQTPAPVQPPAPVQTPTPVPVLADKALDSRVGGVYRNPTLGTLYVAASANGISVTKDGAVISMHHLLYATYDGADGSGIVHSVHFEFDAQGSVNALQYSSNGTGQVTFTRVTK